MKRIQEKRKHIRLRAYHLGKAKPPDSGKADSALYRVVAIQDLSAGGVRFKTSVPAEVSSVIDLKMIFPPLGKIVIASAKVAWIRKIERSSNYEVGAQFINIDKDTRKLIDENARLFASQPGQKRERVGH